MSGVGEVNQSKEEVLSDTSKRIVYIKTGDGPAYNPPFPPPNTHKMPTLMVD
jgi:hypothetical protein